MESTDRLDKQPVAREIDGPRPSDGIGRALRGTFPALKDTPAELADLIAELDAIPSDLLRGSAFQPHP